MKILTRTLERLGTADTDVFDLTEDVADLVRESGVRAGQAVVFVPGSTAAVTTIEFESGAVADLKRAVERLAPRDGEYQHDLRWADGNGYAHLRAALLGPSVVVPIADGRLQTGTWQQIVLLDFDNRPRRRKVVVQVSGVE
jgi:secondary thiamine-phosphate synthase enzyme